MSASTGRAEIHASLLHPCIVERDVDLDVARQAIAAEVGTIAAIAADSAAVAPCPASSGLLRGRSASVPTARCAALNRATVQRYRPGAASTYQRRSAAATSRRPRASRRAARDWAVGRGRQP
jgi:hypothetical protein